MAAEAGRLSGRIAIVTGAGLGQGRSTALRLAREGARVIAVDISGAEADTAAELPEAVTPLNADVTDEAAIKAMVAAATDHHGRLDILCNVVGVSAAPALITELDEAAIDRLMAVNLKSMLLGMKHAVPAIVASGGGSVVNWSSVRGLVASEGTALYGATKAAIMSVTRTAAREYGRHGVRVNTICPGVVYPTGMTAAGTREHPDVARAMAAKTALDRLGHPDEVAAVAAFLASDDASYITGATVVVDGGWTAGG